MRLVVPKLYGNRLNFAQACFSKSDQPGFWEERGYHDRGDPWKRSATALAARRCLFHARIQRVVQRCSARWLLRRALGQSVRDDG